MTRSKQAKQSAAKKRSWQPGGAHRIAHEQRMQAKKTAPLGHRTSQPASAVIGHQKAAHASPPHYPIPDIVKCMRISARMLEIADDTNSYLNSINASQANLLRAAAADLESQTAWSDQ